MDHRISVPEWHAMAQAGKSVPMRIPIHGNSMYPLIRMDRDMATIVPLRETPRVGDIVLFADPANDRFVVHRVWKTEENRVLAWGDNCNQPDGWLPLDIVWGRVVLIERGRCTINANPKRGLLWARVWHKLGRAYRWNQWLRGALARRLSRLFKHGG